MLGAPTKTDVERQFREAVAAAPARFIGAISPGVRDAWTLTLRWGVEEVHFHYCAGPVRNGTFERVCTRGSSGDVVRRERVRAFKVARCADWKGRTPDFFVRDGWVIGEISWQVDRRGRALPAGGVLRYPIAYPPAEASRSRFGFSVSAPFESEDTRYAPARGHADNELLLQRADDAVLREILPILLDREGPSALRLLRDTAHPEASREDEICARALAEGAVAVAAAEGDVRLGILKRRGDIAVPVSGPTGLEQIDWRLLPFAPKSLPVMAARTPPFFIQALARAKLSDKPYRVRWIRTSVVVSRLIEAPAGGTPLSRFKEMLVLLGRLAADGTLAPALQKRLADEGRLPTRAGYWVPWSKTRRHLDDLPDVHGAPPAQVVRSELNDCSILRSGSTKLRNFNLDDHLRGADFRLAPPEQRERFFLWLRRNWSELDSPTWTELARQPVWPIEGGGHRPLGEICLLRSPATRELLKDHVATPSEALRTFGGLKAGSRASFRITRRPSDAELAAWYAERRNRVDAAPEENQSIEAWKLDDDLATLLTDKDLGPSAIRSLGPHVTATKAGTLDAVADLHLEAEPVTRCILLACDLLPPGRTRLYQLFEAREVPSHEAVLRALKADPRTDQILYDRLAAYRRSASLDTLAFEPIIPTPQGLAAPATLKLRSAKIAERDVWGSWRREFVPAEPTPRRTDLLLRAGVAPPELSASLSREFFLWLGNQPASVQYDHLRQVLRHWVDAARGPLSWWRRPEYAAIRCLPVESYPAGARLISRTELSRAKTSILLPDDPVLWSLARQRDPKLGFIIVQIEGVAGSILQALRHDPEVRSLREAAGAPVAIKTEGPAHADPELLTFVRRLHKGKVGDTLPKNLQQYEVPAEDLRQNWRHLLSGIVEVRRVGKVTARYQLRRTPYDVQVRGAPDGERELLFVGEGGDPVRGLYEAVAQLILHRTTSLSGAAVQAAAESGNYDFRFSGARGPAEREEDGDEPGSNGPGPGDMRRGHDPRAAIDRLPDPKPFETSGIDPKGPKRPSRPRASRTSPPKGPSVRDTIKEAEEKAALREGHYAYHCQACLGAYQPDQVAPPDSYVSVAAYRSMLLHAHHVDHLQTHVVLGARNLLLLCEYHHRKLGDLLTGAKVVAAIADAQPATRRFELNGAKTLLKGLIAEIEVDSPERLVRVFFTREHAQAWQLRTPR